MSKPHIVLIDDESTDRSQKLLARALSDTASVELLAPEAVTRSSIDRAHLVLIDFNLGNWPEVRGVPIARRPANGLALSAVLRAHLGDKGLLSARATAFALRSGFLAELVGANVGSRGAQVVARLNNLEWVFEKGGSEGPRQIVILGSAVERLRRRWRPKSLTFRSAMVDLLHVPRVPWSETALEDVLACHPPIHEVSRARHGIPFLRWMLQRILPYPTFLWSSTRVAHRLRISEAALATLLTRRSSRLASHLRRATYNGILADFLGTRWWAAGVEASLWALTQGHPHDPLLLARLSEQPVPVDTQSSDTVLTIDADFRLVADPVPSRLAVRVFPDDWPSFAEQPWASVELIDDAPHVRAIALKSDLERIGDARSHAVQR